MPFVDILIFTTQRKHQHEKSTVGRNMPVLFACNWNSIDFGWPLQFYFRQKSNRYSCSNISFLTSVINLLAHLELVYIIVNHEICSRCVSCSLKPELKLICCNWGSSIHCQILWDSPTSLISRDQVTAHSNPRETIELLFRCNVSSPWRSPNHSVSDILRCSKTNSCR